MNKTMQENLKIVQLIDGEVRANSQVIAQKLKIDHDRLCNNLHRNKKKLLEFGKIVSRPILINNSRKAVQCLFLNKDQCNWFLDKSNSKQVKHFVKNLNLEFSFEGLIPLLSEDLIPINLDELVEQGLLKRKNKDWYILNVSQFTDLPKPVERKIVECEPSKSGILIRLEQPTPESIKSYRKLIGNLKSRESLV